MSKQGQDPDRGALRKSTHLTDVDGEARSHPILPGLPTGTGLGKYRILERIRTYHNAVVYKARDAMLDRLVAVKQMSPDLIDNPIACGNFKREAQLLARIPKDARHILNIHELIEDEIGLFIVEEYVPGHWLESLIFKRRVDHKSAFRLLKTAAQGVRTLHTNRIAHRDIQPGNIMVTKSGGAKLGNLASAAHEGDISPPPVITPKYSAPELLLERKYDDRVDIYGLGLVIFEVCVGRQAMDRYFAEAMGESTLSIGQWIDWHTNLDLRLPDAYELNPLVPAPLCTILSRMTAKSLDDRYTTIDQVLEALAAYFTQAQGSLVTGLPFDRQTGVFAAPIADWQPRRMLPSPASLPTRAQSFAVPASQQPAGNTSTHTVRPTRRGAGGDRAWQWQSVQRPDPWHGPGIAASARHRRHRHHSPGAFPPRPVSVAAIPAPPPAKETFKSHTPRFIAWSLGIVLTLAALAVGGRFAWYYNFGPGSTHPIEAVMAAGIEAYDQGRYELAKAKFIEAQQIEVDKERLRSLKDRADFWLMLIRAQAALESNLFNEVQLILREAEKRGVNSFRVAELQQKAWAKSDAYRLAQEGNRELARGNLAEVEVRLDEYEEKAAQAGMDPNQLKDSLESTKQDRVYQQAIRETMEAMNAGEFLEALNSLQHAEAVRVTTDTRELRKQIQDAQERKELDARGDQAMLDRDFKEAEIVYTRAIQISPSNELETKARTARAYLLMEESKLALAQGDLILAERKLKSSLWNAMTFESKALYEKLLPAFDAARLVHKADRMVEEGDAGGALALYQDAMPILPPPARDFVKEKINSLLRDELMREGDAALQRGDAQAALDAFEQAKLLRGGRDLEELIERAKALAPRPNSD